MDVVVVDTNATVAGVGTFTTNMLQFRPSLSAGSVG